MTWILHSLSTWLLDCSLSFGSFHDLLEGSEESRLFYHSTALLDKPYCAYTRFVVQRERLSHRSLLVQYEEPSSVKRYKTFLAGSTRAGITQNGLREETETEMSFLSQEGSRALLATWGAHGATIKPLQRVSPKFHSLPRPVQGHSSNLSESMPGEDDTVSRQSLRILVYVEGVFR